MPDGKDTRPRHRRAFAAAAWLALQLWAGNALPAQDAGYAPDEVKAAFLYHFGAFVEWPPAAQPEDAITIAVLGDPAVAGQLATMLPGRTVQNRPVRVREIKSIAALGDAQILFIGEEETASLSRHLDALRGRPVLIVTEINGGLDQGAVINFEIVDQRVRFEISLTAARQAGLELSSRLLGIALRVEQSSGLRHPPEGLLGSDPARSAVRWGRAAAT